MGMEELELELRGKGGERVKGDRVGNDSNCSGLNYIYRNNKHWNTIVILTTFQFTLHYHYQCNFITMLYPVIIL